MTKRQMLEEIIKGINYAGGNEMAIKGRLNQPKARIKAVYDYFNRTSKTKQDRLFCLNLLAWQGVR